MTHTQRTAFASSLVLALSLAAAGCAGVDPDYQGGYALIAGGETVADATELQLEPADDLAPNPATSPASLAVVAATTDTRAVRNANGHGNAYLSITRFPFYGGTIRTVNVVDECTGGTYWRISNTSGAILKSGFNSSCMGTGYDGFLSDVRVQAWNSGGYWTSGITY